MVVFPDDVSRYLDDDGRPWQPEDFLFDAEKPNHPTWGFRLHDSSRPAPRGIRGSTWPLDMLRGVLDTSMNALDELELEAFAERTISIPSGVVSTLDFSLTPAQKQQLRDAGYEAAHAFFASAPTGRNIFGAEPPTETLPRATQSQRDAPTQLAGAPRGPRRSR